MCRSGLLRHVTHALHWITRYLFYREQTEKSLGSSRCLRGVNQRELTAVRCLTRYAGVWASLAWLEDEQAFVVGDFYIEVLEKAQPQQAINLASHIGHDDSLHVIDFGV